MTCSNAGRTALWTGAVRARGPDREQSGLRSRKEQSALAAPTRSEADCALGWAAIASGRCRSAVVRQCGPGSRRSLKLKGEGVNPYIPILVLGAISAGFAVFSIGAGALSGPKRYNRAKLDAYECGIEPTPHAAGGGRFPVKYYLVAMLFIVFDIESVFLIPYAVAFDQLRLFGLVEMVLFIVTVFVAYAYVWRRGGLEWD
jgi:NADH-quinone oxidoreductase subunit A